MTVGLKEVFNSAYQHIMGRGGPYISRKVYAKFMSQQYNDLELDNLFSAAAGKYLTVEADEISVTITQTTPVILTAKIPLKRNEEYHVKTI